MHARVYGDYAVIVGHTLCGSLVYRYNLSINTIYDYARFPTIQSRLDAVEGFRIVPRITT